MEQNAGTEQTQPTSQVGALLRASRMRVGVDLREVAESLRIRYPYLVAIEDGQFDQLPGSTYAVGFVRGYAEYLGLDGEEVVRRFKSEIAGHQNGADLDFPTPLHEGRIPSAALIFVGVVLAGLAYGAWYWFSVSEKTSAEIVTEVPARLKDEEPAASVASEPAPAAETQIAEPVTETPSATEPAPEPEAAPEAASEPAPEAAPAEEAAQPAAEPPAEDTVVAEPPAAEPAPAQQAEAAESPTEPAQPAPPPEPRAYGEEFRDQARIVMTVTADSWVEVRSGDEVLLTRLLHPGDVFYAPDRDGMLISTGNAGGLSFRLDGAKVAPIGASGEVLLKKPFGPSLWTADPAQTEPTQPEDGADAGQ